jgi:coenzyme F420-dependent glucose-6-phosphate dehydrogenase
MELYTEQLLPAVAAGEEAAGKPVGSAERMIEIKLSYAHTREEALENTRFWAPLSLTAEQKHGTEDPAEMARLADELPIEQVAKRWIVATDPEDVVSAVKEYVDAGFDHLVFHPPGHDQAGFLRSFAAEVLPGLRELGA